jgi:type I restriction enzyme S subunit
MAYWTQYKFSDFISIIGGGTPKTSVPEYWGGDTPWLSVVDFGGDRKTVYTSERSITAKGLKESSTKLLKKGQIIISARGTVGEIAVLGSDMAFNQSCYGLDAKPELAINNFLYYLLKYKIDSLKAVSHGSVFDTITRQTFEQLEAQLPDLPTQRCIAEILSSLDDKIELNRRMNRTLEQMAQTLFRKYFVEDIDTNNLPDGWKLGNLTDVSRNMRKSINPKELESECRYIGLEHVPRKSIALYE